MRRFFLAFFVLVSFLFLAAAQAKHPFTFEDMMKLKRVGEPEVSPDGKWVIFSVVDVNLEANTKTPHIWIVSLDSHVSQNQGDMGHPRSNTPDNGVPHVSPNLRDVGTTEHILIPDQDGDRPRWSPDGKRFAFLSTKEAGSQVWIADFDSATGVVTDKWRETGIATEASGELWSPDGKNILFTSDVYPECNTPRPGNDEECNAAKLKESEASKVKAQIFEHLLYRHWNAYKEGKRTHIFVADFRKKDDVRPACVINACLPGMQCSCPSRYRDLTPGDYDAPVFSLGGQDDYAFSPDGQEICYASNHDKNPADSTNNDLWIVPVSGGQAKNITADNPASDSTPLYSPDGRYIAYRAQQRPGYESDRFDLMLYDRKTGARRQVLVGPDSSVGTFAWSPDSSRIFYVETDDEAQEKGQKMVWSVNFGEGTI
ncbi:MAG: hypothetical protein WAN60_02685, partial [Candidatus Sulfotelmatobacter sp.]